MTVAPAWNPYFVSYARANGRTPEEMIEHDRAAWPGGCMVGFMVWIGEAMSKAKEAHPEWFNYGRLWRFDDWGAFLEGLAVAQAAAGVDPC